MSQRECRGCGRKLLLVDGLCRFCRGETPLGQSGARNPYLFVYSVQGTACPTCGASEGTACDEPTHEERFYKNACEVESFQFHAATGGDLPCSCGFHDAPAASIGAEPEHTPRGRNEDR